MTQRRGRSLMAEIAEVEKRIEAVEDQELETWTDELEAEEVDIAEESTDVTVDVGVDQNDKAMDNWPVADREAVAKRLLKMARVLLKG